MKPLLEKIYIILWLIGVLIVLAFAISLSKLINAMRLVLAVTSSRAPKP